jgi:hypothetical protein
MARALSGSVHTHPKRFQNTRARDTQASRGKKIQVRILTKTEEAAFGGRRDGRRRENSGYGAAEKKKRGGENRESRLESPKRRRGAFRAFGGGAPVFICRRRAIVILQAYDSQYVQPYMIMVWFRVVAIPSFKQGRLCLWGMMTMMVMMMRALDRIHERMREPMTEGGQRRVERSKPVYAEAEQHDEPSSSLGCIEPDHSRCYLIAHTSGEVAAVFFRGTNFIGDRRRALGYQT